MPPAPVLQDLAEYSRGATPENVGPRAMSVRSWAPWRSGSWGRGCASGRRRSAIARGARSGRPRGEGDLQVLFGRGLRGEPPHGHRRKAATPTDRRARTPTGGPAGPEDGRMKRLPNRGSDVPCHAITHFAPLGTRAAPWRESEDASSDYEESEIASSGTGPWGERAVCVRRRSPA